MEKQSFDRLLESEAKFKTILNELGIKPNSENRIFKSFKKIRSLSEELKKTGEIKDYNKRLFQGRAIEAAMDVFEIDRIIPAIENNLSNTTKNCLVDILSGSEYRSEETVANNKARNTMFELLLLSDFIKAGLPAQLGDQNPDIQLNFKDKNYHIECKRVFNNNDSAVRNNIINARNQLLKQFDNPSVVGIIALSVDRYHTGGKNLLESASGQDATNFLFREQELFIEKYKHLWLDPKIIKSERIISLILYMGVITVTKKENVPSYATNIVITNTITTETSLDLFEKFKVDFSPMLKNNTY